MRGVRDLSGNLTLRGRTCLAVGALSLVAFIVGDAVSKELTERRHQREIGALFTQLSRLVMLVEAKGLQLPPAQPATAFVSIQEPGNREAVRFRHRVKGTIEDPAVNVWLIVHPLDTGAYWVQPRVVTGRTGTWETEAYFGRPSNIDVNREFEVLAVADPTEELQEGQVLLNWPESKWRSSIVTVVRAASES